MKKFFKILMVLALLSGAALSCTKDYSKEIADVQKKNQELEGLIATLQNAINSTNTTVSQVSALADKNEADILALANASAEAFAEIATSHATDVEDIYAALGMKVDKLDLDEKIGVINAAIKAVNDDLAKKTAELMENIDKFAEESKAADKALEEKLAEAIKLITINDNRIKFIEEMLADYPEVKAQVSTNKLDIAVLQRQVQELNAQIEETKAAYKAADKALQEQINELKEVLSARLTNIVAAPAKTVEMLSVTIGDSTFVNLQMDFKVAPAAFAKTIADGFESDDVKVALNITNGYARTRGNAVSEDIDTLVTPFKVVSTKDGIISVTANLSGIVNTPAVNFLFDTAFAAPVGEPNTNKFAPYVSIIVSGTDYEGLTYERISDPVIPIRGSIAHGNNILTALKWFKGESAVVNLAESNGMIEDEIKKAKIANESRDYAFAYDGQLYIALADLDWKTYEKYNNENVTEGYELKIPAEQNVFSGKPISVKEIAEMLDVDYDKVFAPYFVKNNGKTLNPSAYEQTEWRNFPSDVVPAGSPESKLFSSANESGLKVGLGVTALPGEKDTDKAEFVGTYYKVESNNIAYGKLDTLSDYNVTVYQRIGKHVSRKEVTEPLYVPFAYNAGVPIGFGAATPTAIADHSNKKFTAIPWKGETDIARHETGGHLFEVGTTSYTPETAVKYQNEFSIAKITPTSSQTKFADIQLLNVPFQAKEKEYQFVWSLEPYVNEHGVQAEDYLDYINVTVAPYHETVKVEPRRIEGYLSMTVPTKVNTGLGIMGVLGGDRTWFDPQEFTAANQTAWNSWYLERFGGESHTIYADTLGKKVNGYYTKDKKVSLSWVYDVLNVVFEPVPAGFAGNVYEVHAVDTIDNVIAFDYTIPFVAKPIEATIATRDGYVDDGKVTVEGGAQMVNDHYTYVIDDINLDNYFQFTNLSSINPVDRDKLGVKFTRTKNATGDITFSDDFSEIASNISGTSALLKRQCKVSWGTYTGTEFTVKAQTVVDNDIAILNPVSLSFETVDPLGKETAVVCPEQHVAFKSMEMQTINVLRENSTTGDSDYTYSRALQIIPEGFDNLIATATPYGGGVLKSFAEKTPDFGFKTNHPVTSTDPRRRITCTVNDAPYDYSTIIESMDWDGGGSNYIIVTKEHSAIGRIVMTIPFEWKYKFGTLTFDATIVIE